MKRLLAKGKVRHIMQSKKIFPKTLLFFYLIPYLLVLLFTALDCVANYMYIEWYWVTEWMVVLPETIGYYVLLAMVYAFFGVTAYYIFFGKTWQKWTVSVVSVLASFLFPVLRYVVRHIGYGGYLTNVDMLDLYNEDVTTGISLLMYALLALFVILTERAYYAWILRVEPTNEKKIFSPKHPVGITMMLFFGAIAVWATVNFILMGEFTGEAVLSLLVEYVIDLSGFWIAVWAANTHLKWGEKKTLEAMEND